MWYADNKLWKSNKSLYGLKNAPLIFYQTLSTVLLKSGFKSSSLDPCIIYNKELNVYIAMYVNDLLIIGASTKNINKTKKILNRNEGSWYTQNTLRYDNQTLF